MGNERVVQFTDALTTALASLEYSEASTCRDSNRWLVTLPDDVVVYFSRNHTWTPEEIVAEVQRQIAEEKEL